MKVTIPTAELDDSTAAVVAGLLDVTVAELRTDPNLVIRTQNTPGKDPRPCSCGCGGTTKGGKFLPGHDSQLVRRANEAFDESGDLDASLAMVEGHPALEAKVEHHADVFRANKAKREQAAIEADKRRVEREKAKAAKKSPAKKAAAKRVAPKSGEAA